MALTTGSRIGPYEILSPLGAGGMGEVYRARDTKLHRDVAIKVLPEDVAADPDRLARFEREAQALAALNHPNIAAIYGIEEITFAGSKDPALHADGAPGLQPRGISAIVMEFVAGEDLSARIRRGPIPLAEALPLARQIADALAAAHEAGIIHRDLKPANIKVKDDGTVKVLDFGLAKGLDVGRGFSPGGPAGPEGPAYIDPANSPTVSAPFGGAQGGRGTRMGVILGTAAYMSPEQARGRAVDTRADLWAFGVVLFEMATGRPLFSGDTVTDVLASVVTREPDWTQLPAGTPAPMRRLLRRCLEKDPKRRLRNAGDARMEIEDAQSGAADAGPADPTPGDRRVAARSRWAWGGLVAGALVAGVAIGVVAMRTRAPAEAPVRILNLTIPPPARPPLISPDGRWIAVVSNSTLLVKGVEEFAWRPLTASGGAAMPLCWSPDSRRIAFAVGSALKTTDLVGSRPQTICDRCLQATALRGGSWNAAGVILLGGSPDDAGLADGVWQISDEGGTLTRVTSLDAARGENTHRFPTFLPDGRRFIFTVRRDNGEHEIRVGDLSGGPSRVIVSGFSQTAYASGYLLFVRDGTLLALRFDPATATASGDPVKVIENVSESVGTGFASFSAASDGTLIVGQASGTPGYALFDQTGRKIVDVTTRQSLSGGRLSADGGRAAIWEPDPEKAGADIWVVDVATGARRRLTTAPGWEQYGVWSPDGRRVAYMAQPGGRTVVNIQDATGGPEQLVYEHAARGRLSLDDWSPDGKLLIVTMITATGTDLFRLTISDSRLEPLGRGWNARLSPGEGRWMAYVSDETGASEVHVRRFPDGATVRLTTTGGSAPLWSRDGKELYYRDRDGWIVAIGVRVVGAAIVPGAPRRLFRPTTVGLVDSGKSPDVDARGRFFLYSLGDDTNSAASTLTVILNWPKVLTNATPSGGK